MLKKIMGLLAGMVFLYGCGSSNGSSVTSNSYAGAGSQYNITTNSDGTFTVTERPSVGAAVDMTINGTYVTYSTGFEQLTVTSATGTGAPSAGATAVGLEIPGAIYFLKPSGGTGNIIPMIPAGTCPSNTLNENWVTVKVGSSWTYNGTDPSYGTFSFVPSTGTPSIPAAYNLAGGSVTGPTLSTGTCSGGILSISSSGGADMFLSAGGGAIVHTNLSGESGGNDGIVFALPPPSSSVTVTSLAGNYAGLVFASGSSGANFPVSLSLSVSGSTVTGPAYQLSDVTTGTQAGGGAKVTISSAGVANGFVTGTIDTSGPTGGGTAKDFTCTVQQNVGTGSQNILACIGIDQSNNFFSVLLVSH